MVAPVPVYNWSGFYIGLNAGGAWSDPRTGYSNPSTAPGAWCPPGGPVPVPPNPFDLSDCSGRGSSFIGGGQLGYNWQTGSVVYGLEADGAWQHLVNRSRIVFGNGIGGPFGTVAGDTAYFRSEQNALGTFRGRLGYAPSNWLLYVTGGLAVGGIKNQTVEVIFPSTTCTVAVSCRVGTNNSTQVGWTVGAGAEFMLNQNWSIGAEYLYVDLGRTTINFPTQTLAIAQFFASSTTFDNREHVTRLKVNYHFGGPLVAKY